MEQFIVDKCYFLKHVIEDQEFQNKGIQSFPKRYILHKKEFYTYIFIKNMVHKRKRKLYTCKQIITRRKEKYFLACRLRQA